MWRNTCHKEKHKTKNRSICTKAETFLCLLLLQWMHCLGDLLNSLGALSCKSTTGHAPAHRGTAEAKPREWQGAEKISKFQQSFPPHETPQKQCFFFKIHLKKHNIYGVFHHLWRCFTIYDDLVGGSRSLAPSKFCGRTWRAVIIWWRTGSPESVLWKWFFVVHQLKSNHPDISWL